MTIILEKLPRPARRSFAAGMASIGDIWSAARQNIELTDNANASHEALSRAYDARAKELHATTGVQLQNPLEAADSEWRRARLGRFELPLLSTFSLSDDMASLEALRQRKFAEFDRDLAAAVEKIPDRTVADRLMRSIEGDAIRLARESDERLARLLESRPGIGKWTGLLGGGLVGSLNDPVTLLSLGAGAGPGAARTVAGRILAVAGREAVINAATEAAAQPTVQAWREKVGLASGMDDAARNVALAGLFGGVLGGAGQGIADGVSRSLSRTMAARAVDELAARPDAPAPLRSMLDGDAVRAAQTLAPLRRSLPAEARGAMDAAERIAIADAQRPAAATAERHDLSLAAAERGLAAAETWPGFEPDAGQVARVAERIAGRPAAGQASPRMTLSRFLAGRGGVQDATGELRQIGATEVAFRGRGRLVRKNGEPLDMAREAAAEAGYFDHLYGTPDEAVARSTVNDLVEALDSEIRESFATGPGGREVELAALEGTVHDIARLAGPSLPDDLLEAAARMTLDGGMEPGDALERVLTRAELEAPALRGGPGVSEEPLPGWNDDELVAASANRGGTPEPAGLDDPARPAAAADPDAAEIAAADPEMAIPTDAGERTVKEVNDAIRHRNGLAGLVEGCKV